MYDLENRVVIVTGAAGNLGRAVVGRCAEAGARLVLVDRGSGRLTRHFPELATSEAAVLMSDADVSRPAVAEAMANLALGSFGRIDGLVHTVGRFAAGKPASDRDSALLDSLFSANVGSAVAACGAVVPAMRQRHYGRIVTVGALAALDPPPGLALYAAAKSALCDYTRGLARDLRGDGVTVNCILPSILDTPDNRAAMPEVDPRGWVSPDAVADLVVFLLSERARAITGAMIAASGVV